MALSSAAASKVVCELGRRDADGALQLITTFNILFILVRMLAYLINILKMEDLSLRLFD